MNTDIVTEDLNTGRSTQPNRNRKDFCRTFHEISAGVFPEISFEVASVQELSVCFLLEFLPEYFFGRDFSRRWSRNFSWNIPSRVAFGLPLFFPRLLPVFLVRFLQEYTLLVKSVRAIAYIFSLSSFHNFFHRFFFRLVVLYRISCSDLSMIIFRHFPVLLFVSEILTRNCLYFAFFGSHGY